MNITTALVTCPAACANEGNEQSAYRHRNHVSDSYHGSAFLVEDNVWINCALCAAPVDCVQRVPVGHKYYHSSCLRCTVCARTSINNVWHVIHDTPVCPDCTQRGFKPNKQQVLQVKARASIASGRTDTSSPSVKKLLNSQRGSTGMLPAPNNAVSTPASRLQLTGGSPMSSSKRVQQLVERQRAVTKNDSNMLLLK